ncbi:sulfurtransferase [Sinobaca sp. H24]|uniref:sulfurtransferase n=1 Tax=Sinobaca sp. H24 TaxID=2923376 RepID=UPI002079E406|nr:rhodanese-like domain-containing protein [Sinobaca sp. H24]
MKHLITADELEQKIGTETVIADCRFTLGEPEQGRREYEKGHIPGAVHADLEEDLSDITEEHGGRHPLPDMDRFAQKAGEWGIDLTTEVVVYDDQNGAMAARLWWMLRYLGHEHVYVLNSPYSSWVNENRPVDTKVPEPEKKYLQRI